MPRVIHFEVAADDPIARSSLSGHVRLKIDKWDGPQDYWLVTTGAKEETRIDGAIMRRMPGATTINTVDVPSVDEFAQKVVAAAASRYAQVCCPWRGLFCILRGY